MNQNQMLLLFQRCLAAELRAAHRDRVIAWTEATHKESAGLDPIRHMQERARDSTFQFRLHRQGLAGASWLDAT